MKISLHSILYIILIMIGLATLISYLGKYHWLFDLFSHFKLQYLILSLLTLVGCSFLKKYKSVLVFSPILFLLISEIGSLYVGGNKNIELKNTVKIISINLLSSNKNYDDVKNYIDEENPDIVIFEEITRLWETQLNPVLTEYTDKLVLNRTDNFGIALYSKIKLKDISEVYIGNAETPSIRADINIDGIITTILAIHTKPPMGKRRFNDRNDQFVNIKSFKESIDNEFILIGDLNSSSYSYHFKKMISETNLVDSRKGFGLKSSWPTKFPIMYITLDHCLVSEGIGIKSRETGPYVGSDHLPIQIEIGYR